MQYEYKKRPLQNISLFTIKYYIVLLYIVLYPFILYDIIAMLYHILSSYCYCYIVSCFVDTHKQLRTMYNVVRFACKNVTFQMKGVPA